MKDTANSHARLAQLTTLLGDVYGSAEICHQLYALIKMNRPENVVELGSGLGVSTMWMALALEEQGHGEIWSIDDFSMFPSFAANAPEALRHYFDQIGIELSDGSGEQFLNQLCRYVGLSKLPKIINQNIDLNEADFISDQPFADKKIDLVFSDFDSSPASVIQLLVHFLPRMAETSSLFIDSVPTILGSSHMLRTIVSHLNDGIIVRSIKAFLSAEQCEEAVGRRYTLIDLTYNPSGHQCGTVWIKIEPYDVFPHPRVPMRN